MRKKCAISRMASWVIRVMASGETFKKVPCGVSKVLTPCVVTRRYSVSSLPNGRISVNSNSDIPSR